MKWRIQNACLKVLTFTIIGLGPFFFYGTQNMVLIFLIEKVSLKKLNMNLMLTSLLGNVITKLTVNLQIFHFFEKL